MHIPSPIECDFDAIIWDSFCFRSHSAFRHSHAASLGVRLLKVFFRSVRFFVAYSKSGMTEEKDQTKTSLRLASQFSGNFLSVFCVCEIRLPVDLNVRFGRISRGAKNSALLKTHPSLICCSCQRGPTVDQFGRWCCTVHTSRLLLLDACIRQSSSLECMLSLLNTF